MTQWTIKTEYHNAKDCLDIIEKDNGGLRVAVINQNHGQALINARLIAAAPEMLDMLKNMQGGFKWAKQEGGNAYKYAVEDYAGVIDRLINQIEGE